MAEQAIPKVHPSTKAMNKLAKTVTTNFFLQLWKLTCLLVSNQESLIKGEKKKNAEF